MLDHKPTPIARCELEGQGFLKLPCEEMDDLTVTGSITFRSEDDTLTWLDGLTASVTFATDCKVWRGTFTTSQPLRDDASIYILPRASIKLHHHIQIV